MFNHTDLFSNVSECLIPPQSFKNCSLAIWQYAKDCGPPEPVVACKITTEIIHRVFFDASQTMGEWDNGASTDRQSVICITFAFIFMLEHIVLDMSSYAFDYCISQFLYHS